MQVKVDCGQQDSHGEDEQQELEHVAEHCRLCVVDLTVQPSEALPADALVRRAQAAVQAPALALARVDQDVGAGVLAQSGASDCQLQGAGGANELGRDPVRETLESCSPRTRETCELA